jgi:hypothetical protein
MRKFIAAAAVVVVTMFGAGAVDMYGSYQCPEDGCTLFYTGKDDFCVGMGCKHVQYYKCSCCAKIWRVYVN